MFDSYEDSDEWSHRESIADADRHEAQRNEFEGYSFDHADLMWQRTVYQNIVASLVSGVAQFGRDNKSYWLNIAEMKSRGMTNYEIVQEAKIMASHVVG